jgi:hypothetical protein
LSYCKQKSAKYEVGTTVVKTEDNIPPVFNKDSAYAFVEHQVQFGPRVPNTEAHRACARYLANKLEQFCDTIYLQEAFLTAYNGDRLKASNIIGVFNPKQLRRVLLFAHWDSRPYSDRDPDVKNHYKPIDGADDAASGVGVLLEIARQISINEIEIGVDIIFFDAEDYGVPYFINNNTEDTYCLGSQFWVKNPHVPNYKAEYGILLDMVGSKNAAFFKESYSMHYAESIVERVWYTARDKGFGKFFINENIGYVTDDHIYVIKGLGIPCIDIINCDMETSHGFGGYWHTQQDRMDNISHETLEAVGQTILEIIYSDF